MQYGDKKIGVQFGEEKKGLENGDKKNVERLNQKDNSPEQIDPTKNVPHFFQAEPPLGLNNTDHPLCNTDNSKKPSPFFQALPRGTFNPNRSDIGTNE